MARRWLTAGLAACLAFGLTACGPKYESVATAHAGDNLIELAALGGKLTTGENELRVTFTHQGGKPAEVQGPEIQFFMPAVPGMEAMSASSPLMPADKPGVFKGKVILEMRGSWQTTVTFHERGEPHKAVFTTIVP